jgi:hypothetical protein
MPALLFYKMGWLDFHCTYKILFAVHFSHSSFWPSADVKPTSNDQAHVVPWLCMFALSVCVLQSLWEHIDTQIQRCLHPLYSPINTLYKES